MEEADTIPAGAALGSWLGMSDGTHSGTVLKHTQSWRRGTPREKRGKGLKGEEGFNARGQKENPQHLE